MPIRPVTYAPRPYVRDTGTLGQLLGLQAANRGQMWADLGRTISGGLQQHAQERREAPIRAQQDDLRRLELEQARGQQQAQQQATVQEQALTAFMSSPEFAQIPDEEKLRGLTKIAGPQKGPKLFQDWFTSQQAPIKAAQEVADRDAAAAKSERDYRMALNRDGVAEMNTLADNARADAAANKVTFGGLERALVDGRLAFVRPGSDGQTYGLGGQAITGKIRPYVEAKQTENEPLVAIAGPDGKPVLVRRSQAEGKTPASSTSKAASGLEKRALNFFNRARQADLDLEAMESDIAELGLGGQARLQWAPNFAQSEIGQLYRQSQRAFTEARLRKDSGAAIPKEEFENDSKTYFVQPGDSEETIEQKRRGRAAVLGSLGYESGQALGEFVGDSDEAQRIVGEYKTRAERKPDATPSAAQLKGLRAGMGRKFTEGALKGQTWTVDEQGQPKRVN